jgi:hypothetical protein
MRLTEPLTITPRVIDLSGIEPDKAEALELVVSVLKHQDVEFCERFAASVEHQLSPEQPAIRLAT